MEKAHRKENRAELVFLLLDIFSGPKFRRRLAISLQRELTLRDIGFEKREDRDSSLQFDQRQESLNHRCHLTRLAEHTFFCEVVIGHTFNNRLGKPRR